ncbi:hypothetical protein SAMN02745751_03214 [Dethiosulfatibacter aminovorans DSM 17477]|uniref:Uncharacterized protein n=1 Tax=Dethiosulfatibacter aminovorans DSM 17477 TaxID=1121476 RepID=A0A1M6LMF6_9FIRM|nr:hypothetical protein [Dethiosulfatibacter aminovorans]SHJ72325.1 hypothetical protein SAMN02745751_03214 [Dethiosulfatibacter aminovorans DSM 17477]
MRILLIKMSPVEGLNSSTLRTLAVADGLIRLGHEVDYMTIPISNCHVINKNTSIIDSLNIVRANHNQLYDSITVSSKKKSSLKSIFIKLLRSIYHKISIYDYTYNISKNVNIDLLDTKEYDIIISSSDPKSSHVAMRRLIDKGIKYNKWIQYWGDPLANDITHKSMYPKWILRIIEFNLLKTADRIVYVSPFTYKQQVDEFPKLSKKMMWAPIPYIKKKNYVKTLNETYTVGYFGAYKSRVRNINPLYNACKKMEGVVHLNIAGDSDIVLEECKNVCIYPRKNVDDLEGNSDLLVCMLNSSGMQIPGKIYHYAATNKPILVLLDGENKEEMKEYLESFNRYIICDNNKKEIEDTINWIIENPKDYSPCESLNSVSIASEILNGEI